MKYEVGQLLYYCNQKSMSIIPVQVVEQVTRVTLKGEEKKYIVLLPDNEKSTIELAKLEENIFDSIEEVKNFLIENTRNAIEKMAESAHSLSERAFSANLKSRVEIEKSVQVENKSDIITVDLGNGVKAKMNTSSLEKVANK